ncbi:MAG: nucleotide exchange factor GrpE [Verrucomicrobiales bacterium]
MDKRKSKNIPPVAVPPVEEPVEGVFENDLARADQPVRGPESPDPLAVALAEAAQWKDIATRARADHDNFRKRMAQESAEMRKFANASLLEALLPILDNFQFGLQATQSEPAAQNLLTGLNMVAGQLQNFLREHGVEEIKAEGQRFDPNVHEAVAQEASSEVAEGTIISQVRRGFRLRDRLLRPASVVVSTGAPKEKAAMKS